MEKLPLDILLTQLNWAADNHQNQAWSILMKEAARRLAEQQVLLEMLQ